MKRSDMLKLIANQLDFLNNRFNGYRTNFTWRGRVMRILIILFMLGLMVGCVDSRTDTSSKVLQPTSEQPGELLKYEDKEFGVICYRVKSREGISCIYRK